MSAIESVLLLPSERSLAIEYGWEKAKHSDGSAIYSPEGLKLLKDHNLDDAVRKPGDTDFLNGLPVTHIGSGRYSSVYEIGDSGIVVKKHFPETSACGYESVGITRSNSMRRVGGLSIMNSLLINIDLEDALNTTKDYATPKYIGHIMLEGSTGLRHYTLMTLLEEFEPNTEEETGRVDLLKSQAKDTCLAAMRATGKKTKFVEWDITDDRGYHNIIPLKQEGHISLGIIDQQHYFSYGKRISNALLVPRRVQDPDAPWLAVADEELVHSNGVR